MRRYVGDHDTFQKECENHPFAQKSAIVCDLFPETLSTIRLLPESPEHCNLCIGKAVKGWKIPAVKKIKPSRIPTTPWFLNWSPQSSSQSQCQQILISFSFTVTTPPTRLLSAAPYCNLPGVLMTTPCTDPMLRKRLSNKLCGTGYSG